MNPFVLLTAFVTLASALTINTPASVVSCEPLKFTWAAEDSKGPFFLALFPAGQPGADALKQFPPQDGESYTWDKVDLPPNTSFTVGLKDSNGTQAFSAPATVRAGSNTNCPNTAAVGNKEASPNSSSPAAATSSEGPASSRAPVVAASPSPSAAPSPSTAPKPAAASPSGSNSSQSPSVKANSAARDTSRAVIGIMNVVGLMSVAVFLVT